MSAGAPFPHCCAAHGASGGPRLPPEGACGTPKNCLFVAVLPSTDYGAATAIGRQCRDGFLQSLWHHYHYTQCSQRSLVSLGGG